MYRRINDYQSFSKSRSTLDTWSINQGSDGVPDPVRGEFTVFVNHKSRNETDSDGEIGSIAYV